MAWNIPGGSGNNGRTPRKRGNGNPLDTLLEQLRGLFGGGAGGSGNGGPNLVRWAGVLVALWLLFNCFVLITEQQRGVVMRFAQVARVMQPGAHLKWPWTDRQSVGSVKSCSVRVGRGGGRILKKQKTN